MKLLIVESPSKAKTIEKYLDHEYRVVASIGHIRDLPKSNKDAIDIEGGFIPRYVISPGKESVVGEIKALAKKSDTILLATDPDREGEAIAWHVAVTCGIQDPKRVLFYEITEKAVKEAVAHPRKLDTNLRKAQEARRVLDRLVGYDLSGLIWKKVRYGLSAGRVQSPALHILVEREKEIRAFIPKTYHVIVAECLTEKREKIVFTCTEEPAEKKRAEEILMIARKKSWEIIDVTATEAARRPYAPFTTSTLQQAGSSRLGMSPSRTMRAAQKLYEKGHITYMRTDSISLSETALPEIIAAVKKEFGEQYLAVRRYKTKSKNAQEAHEAIRPTDPSKKSVGLTDDEKKLYTLIRIRTLASQMAEAKILRTKILANTEGRALPDFGANGSHLLFDGWLALDTAARSDDVEVPKVTPGAPLTLKDIQAEAKETEPPKRYTEAGLVKELEKRGIGRPSTYAAIVKTIQDRGYVTKEGKALQATDVGVVVDDFLFQHFEHIVSETFTADMENKLDEIAAGKREYEETLKDFYTPFTKEIKSKDKIEKVTNIGDAPAGTKCPKCGAKMVIKLARNGKFFSCSRFPECDGALTDEGKVVLPPKETGESCPQCQDGKLIERDGKFGKFIACSNFPKCKFIKKSADNDQQSTGVKCPVCKKGEMTERRGRFGIFYSCSHYPDCKNAIKAKPTGEICKLCGALMMEGTKTIPNRCSKKECPNHRPDKLEKK
ncbi:MAG: DNA topoisomerase I [Candidatus Moranbacteria bacterium RIFCSPLOWO2_02_FULL_48_19]|nr:MAG: DNA topoisomerase I [Candidatus Moranbacteria bacterium RIFCSPLOWO2_02_FULL_48_19]OGI31989.1 MAG: DNA topoisomerase I [Candidatus Moranbacteria bacterium RIFCSPLOWO2_12_FULL_48_12]